MSWHPFALCTPVATERLLLRAPQAADLQAMFEIHADPIAHRFSPGAPMQRIDQAQQLLAELGYVAMAIDMFGDGKTADHPKDAGKFAAEARADLGAARERFVAALAELHKHPLCDATKTAAIGYCFGGGVVLIAIQRLSAAAAAVFDDDDDNYGGDDE